MDTQAKHTPTPYKACKSHEDFDGPYFDIEEEERAEYDARPYTSIDSASGLVCTAHDLFTFKPGDAEFIVKACNSHAGLVRQLESAYTALLMNDGPERASMEYQALLIFCRGAIASARGESDEVVQNRCEHEAIQRKLQNTCKPLTS